MKPIKILVETFADEGDTNAQMSNGREIMSRLDPERFHVTTFFCDGADPRLLARPNTRLVRLGARRQTPSILRRFLFGDHDLLFYVKASPASRLYMKVRSLRGARGKTVAAVESQLNLRDEPTIAPENIRLLEQTVLRADFLFPNSESVKRSLERNYGRSGEVIPTGVDTTFFSPGSGRAENPRVRVLFAGSLRPFKAPQAVVDAAPRFPQADFVIIGDGLLRSELEARARRISNVSLLGSLDAGAIREQYRRADVFLFPSRWEGSPKVIMEAAACGLPVIARKDYEPETVVDGRTGYLVKSDEEMFSRLESLIGDSEARRRMGKDGRAHMARFSWDVVTRQWENAFVRIVEAR